MLVATVSNKVLQTCLLQLYLTVLKRVAEEGERALLRLAYIHLLQRRDQPVFVRAGKSYDWLGFRLGQLVVVDGDIGRNL